MAWLCFYAWRGWIFENHTLKTLNIPLKKVVLSGRVKCTEGKIVVAHGCRKRKKLICGPKMSISTFSLIMGCTYAPLPPSPYIAPCTPNLHIRVIWSYLWLVGGRRLETRARHSGLLSAHNVVPSSWKKKKMAGSWTRFSSLMAPTESCLSTYQSYSSHFVNMFPLTQIL